MVCEEINRNAADPVERMVWSKGYTKAPVLWQQPRSFPAAPQVPQSPHDEFQGQGQAGTQLGEISVLGMQG